MDELFRRLRYLLFRRRYDAELENDMEFHREMALAAGNRNFGNMLRLREQSREAWGWTWLDRLFQDLRFGLRLFQRSPGFTLIAVLILAIGIGVNTSAFSFFNMAALKLMPVRNPETLIRLERRSPTSYTSEMSYPSFVFYRDHAKTLSAAIASMGVPPLQFEEDGQQATATFVTPNYFTELGLQPAYGRLLSPLLDSAIPSAPVVVLSNGFWQRRFASDPAIIGRTVKINKKAVTVIGITGYAMPTLGGDNPDLWMPLAQQPLLIEGSKSLTDPTDLTLRMWGRLAPNVTASMAEQELRTLTNELRHEQPNAVWEKEFLQISPGGHLKVMKPEMYQVAVMVGVLTLLILAVSCANLGGLMLARAVQREHEIGIRVSIGANRARIFRQLFTESLLLAIVGAISGLALGAVVLRLVMNKTEAPKWISALPDWRVLAFTFGISLFAALFFGLAPALQIARQKQSKAIARQILVGAQIASSCVLLIVSALLIRATRHALYNDPGFGYEQLVSIDPQLGRHGYTPTAAKTYLEQMQTRLQANPRVRSVALVKLPPLGHSVTREGTEINGRQVTIYPNWVTPEFFQTMGIPILLGRSFYPGEKNAVVVSQSFAHQHWPGENPIGQQAGSGNGKQKDIVVGVAGDAHINALGDSDATEQYWPAQQSDLPRMSLVVRATGEPSSLMPEIKGIAAGLDSNIFPESRQLKLLYQSNVQNIEQATMAISLIGATAVLLVGIGIVGLVAYTVSQRMKELAIRLALGANSLQVLLAILRQFSWPVCIGVVLGTGATAATSRLLRRTLYGISNLDPVGYVSAIGVLILVVALAALLPAQRALRVNVSKVLRYD